jgi:saccharopine dehydrogenase (NADP+, L-glutamate forming)
MDSTQVLVLGAGRSSSALIHYLISQASTNNWHVTVGDISIQAAQERIGNATHATAIHFNIENRDVSEMAIASASIVVSLLPAHLHPLVAKICLAHSKHLLTASYVSDEMKVLDAEAKAKNLILLNECGLDPGIDHMSAMQLIDKIKAQGGTLHSFESFTGGLIAPETDPANPWRYKFTWNPRNVVMAGQGTAKYLQDGKYKYIPYQQLFIRTTPVVVPGYGSYEGYANRDSLKYLETYGLNKIKTMVRGTLRNQGYCNAWNVLVQLGCCDESYSMEGVASMTHSSFIDSFLASESGKLPEEKIAQTFSISPDGEEMKRLKWIGLFTSEPVGLTTGTPAQILEHIFNKKWKLAEGDKDFIVMWHRFVYELGGSKKEIQAHLTATGTDEVQTAMAKTVGLPLGIAAKLILQGKIKSRGVIIPVTKEFYDPILSELHTMGIGLLEREID